MTTTTTEKQVEDQGWKNYDHHRHRKTSVRIEVGKIIMTHVKYVSEDRRAQAITSKNVYLHRNYSFVTLSLKKQLPSNKTKIMPFPQQHVQTAACSIPSSTIPSNTVLK